METVSNSTMRQRILVKKVTSVQYIPIYEVGTDFSDAFSRFRRSVVSEIFDNRYNYDTNIEI